MTHKPSFWFYIIFFTSYFAIGTFGYIFYPVYQYPILAIVFILHLIGTVLHAVRNKVENNGAEILIGSIVAFISVIFYKMLGDILPFDYTFLFYWIGGLVVNSVVLYIISVNKKYIKEK